MEREILFRGKCCDIGLWYEGMPVRASDPPYRICAISIPEKRTRVQINPETLGQYTGLTDKNGKKIFEGDIVRYGDTTHEVVFEQRNNTAYFGLVYGPQETLLFGNYQDLRQITVIGNIHDNPEMLEDMKND